MTEEQIADAIRSIADHAHEAYLNQKYKILHRDLESLKNLADQIHKE